MPNEFDAFYRELRHTIQSEISVAYPIIGVIVETTPNKEYCNVETDNGIIANIPAHGIPVVGDSAIIHFINGNYEQPVCDCARRMPPPEEALTELYTSQCFNYLNNGDFHNDSKGYTLNEKYEIPIFEGDSVTGNNKSGILQENDHVTIDCDISECDSDYFKFQCCFQGNSNLMVGVEDAETNELIPPLPLTLNKDVSLWTNNNGRFGWVFNKEAYIRDDIEKIRINLMNYRTEKTKKINVGEEIMDEPTSIIIDGLLVYDENGDTSYYNSVQDELDTH